MKELVKKLQIIFWSVLLGAAIFFAVGYIIDFKQIADENMKTGIKSIILLYLLISIPLTLKWFSVKMKKITKTADAAKKIAEYQKLAIRRMILIYSGLFLLILGYFLLGSTDLLYAVGISLIVLLLCIPTKVRTEGDLLAETEEKTNLTD